MINGCFEQLFIAQKHSEELSVSENGNLSFDKSDKPDKSLLILKISKCIFVAD